MKKLIWTGVAVLIVVGGALFFNLNSVVKATIEMAGERAVGTKVHVGSVSVSLKERVAKISGLTINNPKGFSSAPLLKTDGISVTVDAVDGRVVTIKDVVVDGMTVTYELGPQGANFNAVQKNLKAVEAAQTSVQAKGQDDENAHVIIQRLRIINAQLIPSIGIASKTIKLPNIVLTNIGSPGAPATPVQVAVQVLDKIIATGLSAVVNSGLTNPVGALKTQMESGLKGLFK